MVAYLWDLLCIDLVLHVWFGFSLLILIVFGDSVNSVVICHFDLYDFCLCFGFMGW